MRTLQGSAWGHADPPKPRPFLGAEGLVIHSKSKWIHLVRCPTLFYWVLQHLQHLMCNFSRPNRGRPKCQNQLSPTLSHFPAKSAQTRWFLMYTTQSWPNTVRYKLIPLWNLKHGLFSCHTIIQAFTVCGWVTRHISGPPAHMPGVICAETVPCNSQGHSYTLLP